MKYATQFIVQHGWKLLIADMGLNPAEVLRRAELPGDLFDSFAGSTTGKSILEEQPNSISSGRTMEEIVRDWTRPKNKYTRQTKLFDEK